MKREVFTRTTILLLLLGVSLLFYGMIRVFFTAILLAGIFSALVYPLYREILLKTSGKQRLASATTIVLLVLLFIVPLGGFLGVVVGQGVKASAAVGPWLESKLSSSDPLSDIIGLLPFSEWILPHKAMVLQKIAEGIGRFTDVMLGTFSSATRFTLAFVLELFLMIYSMYFFLIDGDKLLRKILYYLPLESKDEERLLDLFLSVSKAMLKGTAVIGVIQGGLAGLAFAIVGISSPVFWGTVMCFLSLIPGVGTGLVWVPAAIILAIDGQVTHAACLALFCGLVVGTVDNVLRPRLVGKDTKMHELLILFSILGGIALFGIPGVIFGPIVAALFVSIWELYGEVFREVLPEVRYPFYVKVEKLAKKKAAKD